MPQSRTATQTKTTYQPRDIYQQVTNTIIAQLEAGTVPWQKPWTGGSDRLFDLPLNFTTGKGYRGVNIVLLWSATLQKEFASPEWASFKQWQGKEEAIRKGEKGTPIVYYDTMMREEEGEIKKIPFIKTSVVFNRCQLATYKPEDSAIDKPERPCLVERLALVDDFIANTKAIVEYKAGGACYMPSLDRIEMPHPSAFINTETCSATEHFYSVLAHELTHWTGDKRRLNRTFGKRFGDPTYAAEELTAELGAAFFCAKLGISTPERADHAAYIASWLKALKEDKKCIFTAASQASKAIDYMESLQPG